MTTEEFQPLAQSIADQLGETESGPVNQIARALAVCGVDRVQPVLAETLEVEAGGGMLLPDGSRRRTPGGAFFVLLRREASKEEWHRIHYQQEAKAALPVLPPLDWAERAEAVNELSAEMGVASSAIYKVAGRPKEVKRQDDFVVVTIDDVGESPLGSLELPRPPRLTTTHRVCISLKQWRKVKDVANSPQAVLVASGYAMPNIKQRTIVVFANQVSTRVSNTIIRPQVKLSGRPGKVIQRGSTIVVNMASDRAPRMPNDLPDLPRRPVPYTIYIAAKNWNKAGPAVESGESQLFVDGFGFYDSDLSGISVLAQNVFSQSRPQAEPPVETEPLLE
ncbi:MAG: hypothetical protein FJ030_05830 [Chloroflexi bacterium]|nr:hypothetical protein [Chloroflexota bacterium]